MTERIVFPDIEKAVIGYLTAKLTAAGDTAVVASKISGERPPRGVRVYRDDRKWRLDRVEHEGRRGATKILDRPRMVFECHDDNPNSSPADLASLVRSLIIAAAPGNIGTVWCDDAEDGGMENDFDTTINSPVQVVVVDLIVRGKVPA